MKHSREEVSCPAFRGLYSTYTSFGCPMWIDSFSPQRNTASITRPREMGSGRPSMS